jgi:hypothetical protein
MPRLGKSALLAAVVLLAGCPATACAQSPSGPAASAPPSVAALARTTSQPSGTPTAASPTAAPTTPSPTAAPTTPSPTTAPSTATTAPSPSVSSSPASGGGSGTNLIWLWVVLGALALLGIILLATRSPGRGRPSPAATAWRSRVTDAYAKGAALDSAVRAAERQGVLSEPDQARWADLQRRADDLTETLYAMRDTAPSEGRRAQVGNAILALQALREEIDAQRSPGGPSPYQARALHARLAELESSLNALRVPEEPYP